MFQWMLLSVFGCNQEPALLREQRCHQNDMEACYEIGISALNLPRPDIGTARREFAKGCQMKHHPPSCNQLAMMSRDARGGPRDLTRAADLFKIACEADGDVEKSIQSACVNLGRAMYDGLGTKVDHEGAVTLFRTACDHPNDPMPIACAALGVAYSDGVGVDGKDIDKAEQLFRRSCNDAYAAACVLVGATYEQKRNGRQSENLSTALEFYDKACNLDKHFGCYEFADLHKSGKPTDASDKKAAEYYQTTCSVDPTRGCFEAAQLMESGRVTASTTEIESLYNNACEHGNTAACGKRSLSD